MIAVQAAWKRVEHDDGSLRRVFADVHSAAEDSSGRVQHDDLQIFALGKQFQPGGKLAQHRLVEQIVIWMIER